MAARLPNITKMSAIPLPGPTPTSQLKELAKAPPSLQ